MQSSAQTADGPPVPPGRVRSDRSRLLPLLLGALVVIVIASGWTWRELLAAPAPVEMVGPEKLDPDVLVFLQAKLEQTRGNARSADAHGDLGLAYMANRRWTEARRSFDIAAQLEPGEPMWRLHRAICDFGTGDVNLALAAYEALLEELPDSTALLYRLGDRLFDANRQDEALVCFERLIELAPRLPEGYLGRGKIHNQRQQWSEAVKDLEQAVKLDRGYRTANYQLGLAYKGVGDIKRARGALKRGQNSKPRYLPTALDETLHGYAVRYNRELAKAERLYEEGRTKRARGILETFHRLRPNDVNVLTRLARMYRRLEEPAKAKEILKRAIEINPDRLETSGELVETLLSARAPKKALAEADRALALDPEATLPVLVKGRVLLAMKNAKEADVLLQSLADRYPGDLDIRVQLCQLNLDAGRRHVASRWLKEARNLAPDDERIATLSEALKRLPQSGQ